jgi:hypothetical protein
MLDVDDAVRAARPSVDAGASRSSALHESIIHTGSTTSIR